VRRRLPIAGLLFFMAASHAVAQTGVKASVDRPTVRLGQGFAISVQISGSPVEKIVLPDVDGLRISTSPFDTRTQMIFSGGVSEHVVDLKYQAVVSKSGPFTIPPIRVTIDDKEYASAPISIEVVDSQRQRDSRQPASRQAQPEAESAEELTVDDLCFLRATADKQTVYQGEGILVTFELWQLNSPRFRLGQPQLDLRYQQVPAVGFYVVDLGNRRRNEQHKGYAYTVEQYRKLMFPTGTGDLTIGSFEFQSRAQIYQQSFPGVQQKIYDLATAPIPVTVKPLPPRPDHFTGGVGSFTVSGMISDTEVVVGEPTTLVVTVMGEGNPESIGAPASPAIEQAHVSDADAIVETLSNRDELRIEKRFEYQITPTAPGTLPVPPVQLAFFDPSREEYVTMTTDPYEISVAPAPEGQPRVVVDSSTQSVGQRTGVEVVGRDLRPIVTEPGPIYMAGGRLGFIFLASVPPALYLALAFFMRRRQRFANDSRLARAHYAKSRGRKRLAEVDQARDPAEALYRALAGFVADLFDVPEGGLTPQDAEQIFRKANVEPQLAEGIVKTLRACERSRYGSSQLSPKEVHALLDASEVNMERLEAALRARKVAS
jgi:hypothetical protein